MDSHCFYLSTMIDSCLSNITAPSFNMALCTGIILCMVPVNDRWRYVVTSSLIGWEHTHSDPRHIYLTKLGVPWRLCRNNSLSVWYWPIHPFSLIIFITTRTWQLRYNQYISIHIIAVKDTKGAIKNCTNCAKLVTCFCNRSTFVLTSDVENQNFPFSICSKSKYGGGGHWTNFFRFSLYELISLAKQ